MSKPDILTFQTEEQTRKASELLMEKFPHFCEERFLITHALPVLCLVWEKTRPLLKHEKPQVMTILRNAGIITI